jgi:hypothetical protein
MLDTLKLYETFKAASLSDEHARAMTTAMQNTEAAALLDARAQLHEEFGRFHATFVSKAEFETRLTQVELKIGQVETRLIRWMFIFWMGQMAVTVGLVLEVSKLLK